MKFSILLPTRNRLDLLRLAIETVRLQDYADWEIVVSDNCSDAPVGPYVQSLGDPRIRCFRAETFLPVTENWNVALERSTGDYVIMLGDDDGLMRGCLTCASSLIEQWGHPDAIYTEAWQYGYPGVVPGHPRGFIQIGYNSFIENATRPFRLNKEIALEMVRSSASFRLRFGYNMQHFVISRGLINALRTKGPFFQSPYPDYYAANAILLAATSVVVNPTPLVMIGISPKSFGFYFHNNRESDGVAFLQNTASQDSVKRLKATLVPGTNMNDSWLYAMEILAENFCDDVAVRVDYDRYRLLQFLACVRSRTWRGMYSVLAHARFDEFVRYGALASKYLVAYLLPVDRRLRIQERIRASLSAFPRFDARTQDVPYRDLLEAVRNYDA